MHKLCNIIFRPAQTAIYLTDKVYKVILWALGFFTIIIGIILAYSFSIKYYDYTFTDNVCLYIASNDESNIKFENNKLTGSEYSIKGEGVYIYYLKSDFAHNDYGLVMNYKEEEVDIYYRFYNKITVKYSELDANDFTFSDVKYNKGLSRIYYEGFLMGAVDKINTKASFHLFLDSFINVLTMFFVVVLVSSVFSFFVNPMIKLKHRVRLCVYDSLIYLVFMMVVLIFKINWLQYVALAIPLIYTNISFKKIVVLRR